MLPLKSVRITLWGCFLLFVSLDVRGQVNRVDSLLTALSVCETRTDSTETLHYLMGALVNNYPDSAMFFARQAYELSETLQDPVLHGQSYMNLTHCYFVQGHLDSCRNTLLEALELYKSSNQTDKEAAVFRNLAVLGEVENQPDTSLKYLDHCLEVLDRAPNNNILGDVYLSKGFAYNTKGYYNLAVENYLEALRIFEDNGTRNQMGYACQNLGIVFELMDRTEDAIERSLQACEHFASQENIRALCQTQNNLGYMYRDQERYDEAKALHRKSIDLAQRTNQPDVVTQNYWNLAKIALSEGKLDSTMILADATLVAAEDFNSAFYRGGPWRLKAKAELQRGRSTQAQNYLEQSLPYLEKYYDPQFTQEAYEDLADIYEALGQPLEALSFTQKASEIEDSLYSVRKEQQIEELNLIYETEKKDAAIELLEKNAELETARRRGLIVGIVLLGILSLAIIYFLWQKRIKDRQIHQSEKELEVERRKTAEQELEFKQKELTGKVLQLARKNEFLLSLEKEMSDLHTDSDVEQKRQTRRLSRMIYRNTADDEDWDQFVSEFTSVYQEFMDKFMEQHGPLTKNEVRLITLLKMNLSSKDIADTLRISQEGIKKARYRLRKKLMLSSEIDIQSYILQFN